MTRGTSAATFVIAALATCALAGWAGMQRFDTTPGGAAAAPLQWPAGAPPRAPGRATIVLFAHPDCSCTSASLDELQNLLPELPSGTEIRIWFEQGPKAPGALWKRAEAMHGSPAWDVGGRIARSFGARTSGQTYGYDLQGALRFQGGITIARGHSGRSRGGDELISAFRTHSTPVRFTVFGCALFEEQS